MPPLYDPANLVSRTVVQFILKVQQHTRDQTHSASARHMQSAADAIAYMPALAVIQSERQFTSVSRH